MRGGNWVVHGGFYDSVTKLVHFGARDYDPETGRFMQRDPILFGGGQANLYAYVNNDPVNRVDPTGRNWYKLVGGAFLAAVCAGLEALDKNADMISLAATEEYLRYLRESVQRLESIEVEARRRCDHDTAVEAAELKYKTFTEIKLIEEKLAGAGANGEDLLRVAVCGAIEAGYIKYF